MLDRYTITLQSHELALVLGVDVGDKYYPKFNAAPTQKLPIVTSKNTDQLSFFTWGLMTMWAKNKTMSSKFFNLPASSVATKSTYRKKLMSHRCVIPMDGYYIWKKVSKKQLVPYYFTFPDKKIFSVAGLWEKDGEENYSFIMITRAANEQLEEFQEDMPAVLDAPSTRKWLETNQEEELHNMLHTSLEEEFVSHPVSPKINDIDQNDPHLIVPAPPSDQHGNYTLFT